MFDTASVLWLQQWATPALTTFMSGVSFLGYVPSCVTVAAVAAFGWRLRAGLVVLLAIALAAVLTDAAKSTFETPRPDTSDARVKPFGSVTPFGHSSEDALPGSETFGFPSGHVSATTALSLGIAWLAGSRAVFGVAAFWIVMMAVSRMYLGRHFPGDVIGGAVVGAGALWIMVRALRAPDPARLPWARGQGGWLLAGLASIVAILALTTRLIEAQDAGRFCGFAVAAMLLSRSGLVDDAAALPALLLRVPIALVCFGVALWWSVSPPLTLDGAAFASRLAATAVANAAALAAPVLLVRVSRRP